MAEKKKGNFNPNLIKFLLLLGGGLKRLLLSTCTRERERERRREPWGSG